MSFNQKLLLTSAAVLSVAAASSVEAEEIWTPRTVEQVRAELVKNEEGQTYTIQYGDTLGTIAQAMGIDLELLAQVNTIADVDLIHPGVVISSHYNEKTEVNQIAIQTADEEGTVTLEEDTVSQVLVEDKQGQTVQEVSLPQTITVDEPEVAEVTENAAGLSSETVVDEVSTSVESAEETTAETVEEEISLTEEESVALVEEESRQTEEVAEVVVTESSEDDSTVSVADVVETETDDLSESVEEGQDFATPVEEPSVQVSEGLYPAPAFSTEQLVQEEMQTSSEEEVLEAAQSVDYYALGASNPENAGLQAHVAAFKEEVAAIFGVTSFSLYRPGDSQDHGQGLAVDFMVPVGSDLGDSIAQYAIDRMGTANISYVIWKQSFYSPGNSIYGPAYTWNLMEDRGSVTENHYDHVHVSFNP